MCGKLGFICEKWGLFWKEFQNDVKSKPPLWFDGFFTYVRHANSIFLLLRFYVKSILGIVESQKLLFFRILKALNFNFDHCAIFRAELYQKLNFKASKYTEMADIYHLQNWFHVKYDWYKNPEIFQIKLRYFVFFNKFNPHLTLFLVQKSPSQI